MSLRAAGSHTICAERDGFVPTGIALCTVTPGDVVGEADLELLPPHAPRATASEMATMEPRRVRVRIACQGTDRMQTPPVAGRAARVVASVLVVLAGIGAGAGPADAHICPVVAAIPVGELSTVTVAVTVEGASVPDVEMQVPEQLRVDRVDPSPGWTITQQGQTIRYHGPPIAPYTCKYFSIGVTAQAKGAYAITVIQRDAEGKVVARSTLQGALTSQNPYAVQHVYAGVKPPSESSGGGGLSTTTIAGAVLIGLAVVAAVVIAVRSWRARRAEARAADVDERVEEFRKQARDRSQR
jgi:hypothetical protein